MRQAYDDTSPCTRCGSSMEDCDCCAAYELRSSMHALGLSSQANNYVGSYALQQIDYKLSALNRMLREFGY